MLSIGSLERGGGASGEPRAYTAGGVDVGDACVGCSESSGDAGFGFAYRVHFIGGE